MPEDPVTAYMKQTRGSLATQPLSCPFCATEMLQHKHCFSHPYPAKGDCILRHYSFDNLHIEKWNARA